MVYVDVDSFHSIKEIRAGSIESSLGLVYSLRSQCHISGFDESHLLPPFVLTLLIE